MSFNFTDFIEIIFSLCCCYILCSEFKMRFIHSLYCSFIIYYFVHETNMAIVNFKDDFFMTY